MTESEFLVGVNGSHTKMKRYDVGHGGDLDADMVDGKHASELGGVLVEHGNEYHNPDFISTESDPTVDASLKGVTKIEIQDHEPKTHNHDDRYYSETEIDAWKHNDEVEGHEGGFNADLLDGLHSSEIGGSLPSGIIVLWSGLVSSIPSGWALCNGAGGTPDLRDRFIIGAGGSKNPGEIGGSSTLSHAGSAVADHAAQTHADGAVNAHSGAGVDPHSAHSGATVADHAAGTSGAHSGSAVKIGTAASNAAPSPHTHSIPALVHTVGQAAAHANHVFTQAINHVFTQPSQHPVLTHQVTQPSDHTNVTPIFYALCYIMKS
jgi:hypothetical protein